MQYKHSATDVFWSYNWTLGAKPKVHFANPNTKTNVIFGLDKLESVLECSDEENSFIPVPRRVMEAALSVINGQMQQAA